jgi:hypothetical protein
VAQGLLGIFGNNIKGGVGGDGGIRTLDTPLERITV